MIVTSLVSSHALAEPDPVVDFNEALRRYVDRGYNSADWAVSDMDVEDLYLPATMAPAIRARAIQAWTDADPPHIRPYLHGHGTSFSWADGRPRNGRQFVTYAESLFVQLSKGTLDGFYNSKTARSLDGKKVLRLNQRFDLMIAGSRECSLSHDWQNRMHETCPTVMMARTATGERYIMLPEYGGLARIVYHEEPRPKQD